MKKYMLLVFALFGMLAIGSCNDDEPVVPPSPGEEIEILEPATPVLMICVTANLSVRICTQRAALTLPTPERTITTAASFKVPS